jgi:hypothetical protein
VPVLFFQGKAGDGFRFVARLSTAFDSVVFIMVPGANHQIAFKVTVSKGTSHMVTNPRDGPELSIDIGEGDFAAIDLDLLEAFLLQCLHRPNVHPLVLSHELLLDPKRDPKMVFYLKPICNEFFLWGRYEKNYDLL